MNLCIPYNVIEPVMEELSSQSWFAVSRNDQSDSTEKRISQNLDQAGVNVSAVLAKTTITLRDLSEMKPGDLIVTSTPAKDPSMVLVGGEPKFRAVVGQHKGKRAIKITRTVARGERSQSRLSS